MDESVKAEYEVAVNKAERLRGWLSLETTDEFLEILKRNIEIRRNPDYAELRKMDDKQFRIQIEASFMAADDMQSILDAFSAIEQQANFANDALQGKNFDEY